MTSMLNQWTLTAMCHSEATNGTTDGLYSGLSERAEAAVAAGALANIEGATGLLKRAIDLIVNE